jgi:hypothetical protein
MKLYFIPLIIVPHDETLLYSSHYCPPRWNFIPLIIVPHDEIRVGDCGMVSVCNLLK